MTLSLTYRMIGFWAVEDLWVLVGGGVVSNEYTKMR